MQCGHWIVQYGTPAFLGRFLADPAREWNRGETVVVVSPRGRERGVLLAPTTEQHARQLNAVADGEVLESFGDTDRTEHDAMIAQGETILNAANDAAAADGLPVSFVDVEALLEPEPTFILHALIWAPTELTAILTRLEKQFQSTLRLHDLSQAPTAVPDAPDAVPGCGKEGCGTSSGGCSSCSTGGGCGTKSCSSGAVKSADELTNYFGQLREQMEARPRGRQPLA